MFRGFLYLISVSGENTFVCQEWKLVQVITIAWSEFEVRRCQIKEIRYGFQYTRGLFSMYFFDNMLSGWGLFFIQFCLVYTKLFLLIDLWHLFWPKKLEWLQPDRYSFCNALVPNTLFSYYRVCVQVLVYDYGQGARSPSKLFVPNFYLTWNFLGKVGSEIFLGDVKIFLNWFFFNFDLFEHKRFFLELKIRKLTFLRYFLT